MEIFNDTLSKKDQDKVDVSEDDAQDIVEDARDLAEKMGETLENSQKTQKVKTANEQPKVTIPRYKRIKNYKEIKNSDGTVEIVVDAGEIGINPPSSAVIAVTPMDDTLPPDTGSPSTEIIEVNNPDSDNCGIDNSRVTKTNNSSGEVTGDTLEAMLAIANLASTPIMSSVQTRVFEDPNKEDYNMVPPVIDFNKGLWD